MEKENPSVIDGIRMDSHKLIYHVERVASWFKGENIFPIFIEVSPTSVCNHRCVFCGLDYARSAGVFLKKEVLSGMVKDAAGRGVKSIIYAGEGEPLLHKDVAEMIVETHNAGIDVAVASNGVLIDENFLKAALKSLKWIRISVDAGTALTYEKIHGARAGDFEKVLKNLSRIVEKRKEKGYRVTIGTQFLLLKENANEAADLARELRKIGVDYFAVKPYSKHPLSINNLSEGLDYSDMVHIEEQLKEYNTVNFRVIFRKGAMLKRNEQKPYAKCYGAPFWAYICANGEIYHCPTFLGIKDYLFGNLNEESFLSIWNGSRRKEIMDYIINKLDVGKCRKICRLNEINTYLWELKNPHPHVNFI